MSSVCLLCESTSSNLGRCNECEDVYCDECFREYHSNSKFKLHVFHKLEDDNDNNINANISNDNDINKEIDNNSNFNKSANTNRTNHTINSYGVESNGSSYNNNSNFNSTMNTPKTPYNHTPNLSIPTSPNIESKKLCSLCEIVYSDIYCMECKDYYCNDCSNSQHNLGKFKLHILKKINDTELPNISLASPRTIPIPSPSNNSVANSNLKILNTAPLQSADSVSRHRRSRSSFIINNAADIAPLPFNLPTTRIIPEDGLMALSKRIENKTPVADLNQSILSHDESPNKLTKDNLQPIFAAPALPPPQAFSQTKINSRVSLNNLPLNLPAPLNLPVPIKSNPSKHTPITPGMDNKYDYNLKPTTPININSIKPSTPLNSLKPSTPVDSKKINHSRGQTQPIINLKKIAFNLEENKIPYDFLTVSPRTHVTPYENGSTQPSLDTTPSSAVDNFKPSNIMDAIAVPTLKISNIADNKRSNEVINASLNLALEPINEICSICEHNDATLSCGSCQTIFCDNCSEEQHGIAKYKTHVVVEIRTNAPPTSNPIFNLNKVIAKTPRQSSIVSVIPPQSSRQFEHGSLTSIHEHTSDTINKNILDYMTSKFEQLSSSILKLQTQNNAGQPSMDKLEKVFSKLNDSIALQSNNLKDISKYVTSNTLAARKDTDIDAKKSKENLNAINNLVEKFKELEKVSKNLQFDHERLDTIAVNIESKLERKIENNLGFIEDLKLKTSSDLEIAFEIEVKRRLEIESQKWQLKEEENIKRIELKYNNKLKKYRDQIEISLQEKLNKEFETKLSEIEKNVEELVSKNLDFIELAAKSKDLESQTDHNEKVNKIEGEQLNVNLNANLVRKEILNSNLAIIQEEDVYPDPEEESFEIHSANTGNIKEPESIISNIDDFENEEKNYDLSDSDQEEPLETTSIVEVIATINKPVEKVMVVPKLNLKLKSNAPNNISVKKTNLAPPPPKLSNRINSNRSAIGVLTQNSNKINIAPLSTKKISIEEKVKLALASFKPVVKKKTEIFKTAQVIKTSDETVNNVTSINATTVSSNSFQPAFSSFNSQKDAPINPVTNFICSQIDEASQEPDEVSSWVSPWEKSGENARDYLKQAILDYNQNATDSTDFSSSLAAVRSKLKSNKSLTKKSYLQDPDLDGIENDSLSGFAYSSSNSLSGQLLYKLEKSFNLNIKPRSSSPRTNLTLDSLVPISKKTSLTANLGKIPPLNFSKLKK